MAVLEGWLAHDYGPASASIAKDKGIFPRVEFATAQVRKQSLNTLFCSD